DPEDESFRGQLLQGADYPPAQALEELARGERPRTVRLAFFRIHEYEVHVGRHVQLGAAELAHADDDELLGLTLMVARHTVLRDEHLVMQPHRLADGELGQPSHGRAHLAEVRATSEVARHGVQHHAATEMTETRRQYLRTL